jgi:protein gp37
MRIAGYSEHDTWWRRWPHVQLWYTRRLLPWNDTISLKEYVIVGSDRHGRIPEAKIAKSCSHVCYKPLSLLLDERADFLHPDLPIHFLAFMMIDVEVHSNKVFHFTTKYPERFQEVMEKCMVYLDDLMLNRIPFHWHSLNEARLKALPNACKNVAQMLCGSPHPRIFCVIKGTERQHLAKVLASAHHFPSHLYTVNVRPLDRPVQLFGHGGVESSVPIQWVTVAGPTGVRQPTFHLQWVEDIAEQCSFARVPLWVERIGANYVGGKVHNTSSQFTTAITGWPKSIQIRQWPSSPNAVFAIHQPIRKMTERRLLASLKQHERHMRQIRGEHPRD